MTAKVLLLAPFALAACVEGMPADPKAPRISQVGTCFAYVVDEGAGKFTLISGIGDGSLAPKAVQKTGLSAAKVDAAYAKELAIMQISPECLAVYAKDRTQAAPPPAMPKPMG